MRLLFALVLGLSVLAGAARADKLQQAEAAFAEFEEDKALALYNEVLAEAPNDAKLQAAAKFGRGEVYAATNRYPQAEADFTAALALQTSPADRATTLVSRAECYARLGRQADALDDYAESLRLAPAQIGVHTARGTMLQRLGRKDEALAEFDAELKRRPGYYRALVGRALILDLPLPPNPEDGRR